MGLTENKRIFKNMSPDYLRIKGDYFINFDLLIG
jgi:hypothetical protein